MPIRWRYFKYLEKIPASKSLWNGECFVFDGRVSVINELKDGTYKMCHACRKPISLVEVNSKNINLVFHVQIVLTKLLMKRKKDFQKGTSKYQLQKKEAYITGLLGKQSQTLSKKYFISFYYSV